MGRTRLLPREISKKELYIGKLIIFCEGSTEKNYFEYFKNRIKDKYTNIVIQTKKVGGNARAVFNYAESYLKEKDKSSIYSMYDKYLVFDCDAPKDILSVIRNASKSNNNFKILITNPLFECWLLMHFETLSKEQLGKKTIGKKLTDYLKLDDYEKHKDDVGIIAQIIKGDGNIKNAIKSAKDLCQEYEKEGMEIDEIINQKLPYSKVYELVQLLDEAVKKSISI